MPLPDINEYLSNLTPEQKSELFENLKAEGLEGKKDPSAQTIPETLPAMRAGEEFKEEAKPKEAAKPKEPPRPPLQSFPPPPVSEKTIISRIGFGKDGVPHTQMPL